MKKSLSISIVIIITAALLCACGGGAPVKQTAAQKPGVQTDKEKPSVQNITNQYYKIIAGYFSRKGYDAGRIYDIQDMIIPNDVEDAVTNLGKNWLSFLRNEIFARHGYNLNNDYLKETLGKAGWYKMDTNFEMVKSLNEKEKKNIDFIIKLEKIDEEGPKEARQLAVVLKLPKEQLTTDEAIKVWKATGKKDVLTKVEKIELANLINEGKIYKQWNDIEKVLPDLWKTNRGKAQYLDLKVKMFEEIKSYLLFKKEDRVFFNIDGDYLIQECLYETTNVQWICKSKEEGEPSIAPSIGIYNINSEGKVIFKNLVYDGGSYIGITNIKFKIAENESITTLKLRMYSANYLKENLKIFSLFIEDGGGTGLMTRIGYRNNTLWNLFDFGSVIIDLKYILNEKGNALYVLIPFNEYLYMGNNEIENLVRENNFFSGVKIFKISLLRSKK